MRKFFKPLLLSVLTAILSHPLQAEAPAYSLPPDKLAKAIALDHAETALAAASIAWSFLSLYLILQLGLAAKLSELARRITPRTWLQGFIFVPILLLLITVIDLPLSLAGHHIALAYGLSIQHWSGYFADRGKSLLLTLASGTIVASILFAIVRNSPRWWWFWFWLISIPLVLGSVYLVPVYVDPLFNHYQPLAQTNPALVEQLERVVYKSGMDIPPSRMFLMKASEKVTTANAYVTGFGNTKRVVVWDTTIHNSTPDGILFIFGHEQGHYVLGHVVTGTVLSILGTLVFLWLTYHIAHWLLSARGQQWRIDSITQWSAVVVLLLALQLLGFFSSPIENAISRHFEHQADIYGEEVIHGIVENPQRTAQQSFQQLGESSLDIPHPNRWIVFWNYSHPTILDRATFALHYNPYTPGHQPKYVR